MQRFIQESLAGLDIRTGPVVLQRGRATIPLKVNVPFHSSLLRPGVQSFRQFLSRNLAESCIHPDRLVNKYIPNLTARPFELSRTYVESVLALTESPVLENLLCNVSFPLLTQLPLLLTNAVHSGNPWKMGDMTNKFCFLGRNWVMRSCLCCKCTYVIITIEYTIPQTLSILYD